MGVVRLLMADDHVMVRQGLKSLLETVGYEVIGEVNNSESCLEILEKRKPDLLLLEVMMNGGDGFEVLEKIHKRKKEALKVLVVTGKKEKEIFRKAMAFGIDGYILKSSAFSELRIAIDAIVDGKLYIQKEIEEECDVRGGTKEKDADKIRLLTKRELEVLKILSTGMYNKEIAIKLEISERTVKNHVSNIFKKIGVADRTQAAVFSIRNGIVDV